MWLRAVLVVLASLAVRHDFSRFRAFPIFKPFMVLETSTLPNDLSLMRLRDCLNWCLRQLPLERPPITVPMRRYYFKMQPFLATLGGAIHRPFELPLRGGLPGHCNLSYNHGFPPFALRPGLYSEALKA